MGHCFTKSSEKEEDDHFSMEGPNVTLITTIKKWDEKPSETNRDSKIVVVNFSATWCSPSKAISPAFCDLADKYSSMMFLTVDVDELAEFSTSWDIKATPTFFFLKNGRSGQICGGKQGRAPEKDNSLCRFSNQFPQLTNHLYSRQCKTVKNGNSAFESCKPCKTYRKFYDEEEKFLFKMRVLFLVKL